MNEKSEGMDPEYIMVCEKCGSEYPLGTSYCTNPLCRANLAVYGKVLQKKASPNTDVACEKIEAMMKEVMSALSGKSFEAEKSSNYQNVFIRIMESVRTAKSDAAIENCLQQAEQWKQACLNEISLLGANLDSDRAQAKARITDAREKVMSALAGKRGEQEKRKEYGAQYDAIWTKVNNSSDSNEIKNCAVQAERLAGQFLAEIHQLDEENVPDPHDEAKLQREIQRAQKQIDAAMEKVLKALSKKKQGDQYRDKYTVGFKNISAKMQQCNTLEDVAACAVQAEELRDSDIREIREMKNRAGAGKVILITLLAACIIAVIGMVAWKLTQDSAFRGEKETDAGTTVAEETDAATTAAEETGTEASAGNWEENVMMSDNYGWFDRSEFSDWAVLGSDDWIRSDITSIVVLDTLDSEAEDSWDVSETQDGSVKAWVEESGSDNILYIAGNGGVCAPEDCNALFAGYGAETIEFGMAFHTDAVTNMYNMFANCDSLKELDVSGFDTSCVTVMGFMFYGCETLETLDITGMDTSAVTDISFMFDGCSSLSELDVSGFNTKRVTSMAYLFIHCSSLRKIDVSNFDTSSVTSMDWMFGDCGNLEKLDVSGFDTSAVTSMYCMFQSCKSLTELDVSNFDTALVTRMAFMFNGCDSLTELDVSGFDTSCVTDMSYMFNGCSNLTELDVSGFDTSQVTNMSYMFSDCSSLTELDVSGFDTSQVTDTSYMFNGCTNLRMLDFSVFNYSGDIEYSYMFNSCESLDLSSLLDIMLNEY